MSHGILSLPLLPIRSDSSDRSEMTTQLLFGELFDVLEVKEGWTLIHNHADGYEGWTTSKMLTMLSDELYEVLATATYLLLSERMMAFQTVDAGHLMLPAGSRLMVLENRFYYPSGTTLTEFIPEKELLVTDLSLSLPERILHTARQFMNAPYLWGGKTILGMDCSGLIQVSASINGYQLPRDANQQAQLGHEEFLSLSQPGDLAFFSNPEGRIVHVGIVCGKNQILHASGSVHIDDLDEQGIYSRQWKKYTHQLHSIKRIFPAYLERLDIKE